MRITSNTDLGRWEPLGPREVAELLHGADFSWWIAGGYAIDAVAGSRRRTHSDLDVGVLAADQMAVQEWLSGWQLWAADPPGTLRRWAHSEWLPPSVHDVWVRQDGEGPWRFQLMLNPSHEGSLVYRRDARISWLLSDAIRMIDGIAFLAADIQLLFKSQNPRGKDEQDFRDAAGCLKPDEIRRLKRALRITASDHPWLGRLAPEA